MTYSSQGNGGGRRSRPQQSAAGTPGVGASRRVTPGQRGGHPEGCLELGAAHNPPSGPTPEPLGASRRSLLETNPYLRNPFVRARAFALTVQSSSAIEGVHLSLLCRCGHSPLMHDSGGGCAVAGCGCRGYRMQ